jgi:transposase
LIANHTQLFVDDPPGIRVSHLREGTKLLRFDSGNQLLKTADYDLGAERSGKKSDKAVPVISKRGNSELRYALYQAAHVASTRNPDFIRYFTRLLQGRQREPGIQTKMRVKLAAKMLKIAWTLMKKEEVFDPSHLELE